MRKMSDLIFIYLLHKVIFLFSNKAENGDPKPFTLQSAFIPLSGSIKSQLKAETDSLYGHKVTVTPTETHSCLQLCWTEYETDTQKQAHAHSKRTISSVSDSSEGHFTKALV